MGKDNFQVVPGQIIDGVNLYYTFNGETAFVTAEKLIGKSSKPLHLVVEDAKTAFPEHFNGDSKTHYVKVLLRDPNDSRKRIVKKEDIPSLFSLPEGAIEIERYLGRLDVVISGEDDCCIYIRPKTKLDITAGAVKKSAAEIKKSIARYESNNVPEEPIDSIASLVEAKRNLPNLESLLRTAPFYDITDKKSAEEILLYAYSTIEDLVKHYQDQQLKMQEVLQLLTIKRFSEEDRSAAEEMCRNALATGIHGEYKPFTSRYEKRYAQKGLVKKQREKIKEVRAALHVIGKSYHDHLLAYLGGQLFAAIHTPQRKDLCIDSETREAFMLDGPLINLITIDNEIPIQSGLTNPHYILMALIDRTIEFLSNSGASSIVANDTNSEYQNFFRKRGFRTSQNRVANYLGKALTCSFHFKSFNPEGLVPVSNVTKLEIEPDPLGKYFSSEDQ